MKGILEKIVEGRRKRIERDGYSMAARMPDARPGGPGQQSFARPAPIIICEVKRKSPSRGSIAPGLDPVAQAGLYKAAGIRCISVLTEQDHFGGSLEDLVSVKTRYPECSVLRKDFLLEPEDVELSYRAGADAVLLIAAILEPRKLALLHRRAEELGLEALVEIHNRQELERVRAAGIRPRLMGINARNLDTFQVDMLEPLQLRREIDWECSVVFESGIFAPEQAALAASMGFSGVLVGEAAVRDPALAGGLVQAFAKPDSFPASGRELWSRVLVRLQTPGRTYPLVKICGLAREEDARLAARLGADLLGFVFAPSPRRAQVSLLESIADLDAVKIAVVTDTPDEGLVAAWSQGLIHGFQYHGKESPAECLKWGLPFYKALSMRSEADVPAIMDQASPRVLVDAWADGLAGGTGKRLDDELVSAASRVKPLWLAGGLRPDNVRSIIRRHSPELVDASSGLERLPGIKDAELMKRYFEEIFNAGVQ